METLIAVIAAVVALVVGLVVGLRLGQRGEAARRVDLQDRLTEAQVALSREQEKVVQLTGEAQGLRARLDERDKAAAQFDEQMREKLDALSQHALSRNSEEFLKLAAQSFEALSKQTTGALATGEERIKGMVDPLAELVKRYDEAIQEMERRREGAYSTLEERLRAMVVAEQGLQSETNKLVTALRRPEVRGRWGEMQLRNAVELAGMSEYCDFEEQVSVPGEGVRPDMVINLPGDRCIVVDAKVPKDAYDRALECTDPERREQLLQEHARQCRNHLDSLAAKKYWEKLPQSMHSPDCVVMFIGAESLFAAAVEADQELINRGLRNRVIIATPSTLVAMLFAVHYGWQQHRFAESALQVRSLAGEFYERLRKFAEPFQDIGKHLGRSVEAYNKSVGSMENRLLVSARRLREMGAADKDLPELEPLDTVPRRLESELSGALPPAEDDVHDETDAPDDET